MMSNVESGRCIGQFRIGRAITQSGLIYSGWDLAERGKTGQSAPVWLQFFDSEQAQHLDEIRRQFEAWGAFQHGSYLKLVGLELEPPVLAMEAAEGTLLSDRLVTDRLDPIEAAKLVFSVAQGIASAHTGDLVNLGISEQRIVVPKFGDDVPRFIGFGADNRPLHEIGKSRVRS